MQGPTSWYASSTGLRNAAAERPLIVTNVLVIAFLALTGHSYDDYFNGAKYIGDLLTPATVCLAIPLYRQLHLLKKHAAAICCGIAAGVLANSLCILLMSLLFGFSRTMYVTAAAEVDHGRDCDARLRGLGGIRRLRCSRRS